jgi:hypothetical protein
LRKRHAADLTASTKLVLSFGGAGTFAPDAFAKRDCINNFQSSRQVTVMCVHYVLLDLEEQHGGLGSIVVIPELAIG